MRLLSAPRARALAACLAGTALAILPCAPTFAQTVDHHQHRFGNAEKWAKIFDDPERDAWQKPAEVIRALALAPAAAVADIGSGTGYFAVRLARTLPQGRVYGVDTEPDMVRYLTHRAKREGISNITAAQAGENDPRIPAPVDLVLMVNTYHHIPERERYFGDLAKSLKPGGRLAVIDFTLDSPHGPPRRARVPPEEVKREVAAAGYQLTEEHGFLPHQYFLVFRPTPGP
jgi:SAM-dependent methyltransferase